MPKQSPNILRFFAASSLRSELRLKMTKGFIPNGNSGMKNLEQLDKFNVPTGVSAYVGAKPSRLAPQLLATYLADEPAGATLTLLTFQLQCRVSYVEISTQILINRLHNLP